MNQLVKSAQNVLSRKSSDLLLSGGVICIIGAGVLAIYRTPKAVSILDKHKNTKTIDKIKTLAPVYGPSIALTAVGIAQIVGSRNITNNKIAAMATAYTVSETAFKTYREKVKDLVEPEKFEKIKQEVAINKLKNDPLSNKEVIINASGDTLIYDNMSGRYFKSSMDNVNRNVNLLNKRLMNEMKISLNEFYSEIGLPNIKMGNDLGWDIGNNIIDIYFTSSIADNGEPCLVMDYDVYPVFNTR